MRPYSRYRKCTIEVGIYEPRTMHSYDQNQACRIFKGNVEWTLKTLWFNYLTIWLWRKLILIIRMYEKVRHFKIFNPARCFISILFVFTWKLLWKIWILWVLFYLSSSSLESILFWLDFIFGSEIAPRNIFFWA